MFQRQENGFTARPTQASEETEGRWRDSNLHPRRLFIHGQTETRTVGLSFKLGFVVTSRDGKLDPIIIFVHSNTDAPPPFSITGAQKYQRCPSGEENDKAQQQNAIKAPDGSLNGANRSIRDGDIFKLLPGEGGTADILREDNININASPSNMHACFCLPPGVVLKAARL